MPNIVFLGDSMTEGVGSRRISYVTELAAHLRSESISVHVYRLRRSVQIGGLDEKLWNWALHSDPCHCPWPDEGRTAVVRFVNLAVEGTTIEDDFDLLPALPSLHPHAVVVFRGIVEGMPRVAPRRYLDLQRMLPKRWQAPGGLEPRCYYSDSWLRGAKQRLGSEFRSRLRRMLISWQGAKPLLDAPAFGERLTKLLQHLRNNLQVPLFLCHLLPVCGKHFPGAAKQFAEMNHHIDLAARQTGSSVIEWDKALPEDAERGSLYYADGLHPNVDGCSLLAQALWQQLQTFLALPLETTKR